MPLPDDIFAQTAAMRDFYRDPRPTSRYFINPLEKAFNRLIVVSRSVHTQGPIPRSG